MKIEQFVMAYGVDHDRLRAILPEGFSSLRPVLRINAEVRDDRTGYVEFNTAVEKDGNKGWLNIEHWDEVPFQKERKTTTFETDFLKISSKKEFCDCEFAWHFHENDAHGVSIGKTLPAIPEEVKTTYLKQEFTVENATAIPCNQVLGTYTVIFER